MPKKAQITQERVEYNVFLFDEPLKGSKSLKIFKISLTFRLSNLSKSVHTGENSQILTVSNKKYIFPLSYTLANCFLYKKNVFNFCDDIQQKKKSTIGKDFQKKVLLEDLYLRRFLFIFILFLNLFIKLQCICEN
jgi:hypothetical protein